MTRATRGRRADQVVALLAAAPEPRARGQQSTSSSSSSTTCSRSRARSRGTTGCSASAEWPRQAAVERVLPGRAAADRSAADASATSAYPGYSREIDEVEAPARRSSAFRFLTVTNSHDLERYNTRAVLEAFRRAFAARDDVVARDQGLRRVVGRHDAPRMLSPSADRGATYRVRHRVHRQARADPALQVVRRVRVGAPRRGLRHEDPRRDGVRPAGDHAALRRSDQLTARRTTALPVDFSLVPDGRLPRHALAADHERTGVGRGRRRQAWRRRCGEVCDDSATQRGDSARGRTRDVLEPLFVGARGHATGRHHDAALRATRERRVPHARDAAVAAKAERSPYWLGLRMSVVIPTYNRKDKLLTCLDALARQSILPQEFEVIVDRRWLDGRDAGGAAGSHAIPSPAVLPAGERGSGRRAQPRHRSAPRGELVLFIGDDIIADERLLEEHLLAHAGTSRAWRRRSRAHRLAGRDDAERRDGLRVRRRDAAVRLLVHPDGCRRSTTGSSTPATSR